MAEDMSNLMNQISQMMQNNQIPDEIQNMMQNLTGNKQSNTDNGNRQDMSSDSSSANNTFPEFDIETMMKMKKVMDAMKTNKDDPRANLLKSLKPYLKESRKEKVDQYIQIFGMGKVFEMLRSSRW